MLSTVVLWQSLYYARFLWYRQIDPTYNHFHFEKEGAVVPHHPVLEYQAIVLRTIEYIQDHETTLKINLQVGVWQVMRRRGSIDAWRLLYKYVLDALHPEKKCKKSHETWFGCELLGGKDSCTACKEARLQVMHRTMGRKHPKMWPLAKVAPEYDKLPVDILESHVSGVYFPNSKDRIEEGATFLNCLTNELMVVSFDNPTHVT